MENQKEKQNQKEKEKLMRLLQCSEAEADDIINTDRMIERGERTPYDLPIEDEKQAAKLANAGRKKMPTNYQFKTRERKENPTKGGIISELAEFLTKNSEFATKNVTVTNKERQISFQIADETFELTLVQKRRPKN